MNRPSIGSAGCNPNTGSPPRRRESAERAQGQAHAAARNYGERHGLDRVDQAEEAATEASTEASTPGRRRQALVAAPARACGQFLRPRLGPACLLMLAGMRSLTAADCATTVVVRFDRVRDPLHLQTRLISIE